MSACSKCGILLDKNVQFCVRCGTPTGATAGSSSSAPIAPPGYSGPVNPSDIFANPGASGVAWGQSVASPNDSFQSGDLSYPDVARPDASTPLPPYPAAPPRPYKPRQSLPPPLAGIRGYGPSPHSQGIAAANGNAGDDWHHLNTNWPFGLPAASWWQRVGSYLLDMVILVIPLFILNFVLLYKYGVSSTTLTTNGYATTKVFSNGWILSSEALDVGLVILYFGLLNGLGSGQTIGNRAPGIRIADERTGAPIGFGRSVLRSFVRIALYVCLVIPGLLNDLWPLWDKKNQTIADKAARCVMVSA